MCNLTQDLLLYNIDSLGFCDFVIWLALFHYFHFTEENVQKTNLMQMKIQIQIRQMR